MSAFTTYTHGAQVLNDGTVYFRLWAPASERVTLHVGEQALPMRRAGEGWFELTHRCPAGGVYCYEPEGVGRVPDPASRQQADDVAGPSVVLDHAGYVWRNEGWRGRPWHEAVFYEAHAGLLGGFDGLRARLPELAGLGITALELMPVADFAGPRNWGYDGVLPYAPDRAYGTPEALKALVDAAHGLEMMVFLDVVYNHFGPVGNFLPRYAPQFFRDDVKTPWGPAIDFRREPVRRFFAENALYWLKEYRFDGLRFDAVHAIVDKEEWLGELAVQLRAALPLERCVHLVLENDDNTASLLRHGYDGQWNDDMHHVVHHLLTGEAHGYYGAYAQRPTEKLARGLAQGFIYQGEPSPAHDGRARGEPSSMLPPTAFVFFLQNHDQVGNRAHGDRLKTLCRARPDALRAAVALQLLCPAIPLIFMGEEQGAETPFLYFTSFSDPEFAAAVAQGRRAEFAAFHADEPGRIPDPNAQETWNASLLPPIDEAARQWQAWYAQLLALRRQYLWPGLKGCSAQDVHVVQEACVIARWRLANGDRLTLACNLSDSRAEVPVNALNAQDTVFYESVSGAAASIRSGGLPACCTVASVLAASEVPADDLEEAP
ncbi:malto-oligosyltrehalose trehalohydrolase [Yanghanlia caeni]|uniref:Malto-oligosyltrehalose trehalohydrolase n=1 Tax=Yanghanlia caeni TaxID=3064283 RepID=A0ABU1D398_9BURK|nr:malto-oligosyltrehalose trehalohydrolase [Alcaligenaceae bacterium LG-2]